MYSLRVQRHIERMEKMNKEGRELPKRSTPLTGDGKTLGEILAAMEAQYEDDVKTIQTASKEQVDEMYNTIGEIK